MTRILVAVVVALLLTKSSIAQSYCDQVRQAVATYGYAAANGTPWLLTAKEKLQSLIGACEEVTGPSEKSKHDPAVGAIMPADGNQTPQRSNRADDAP